MCQSSEQATENLSEITIFLVIRKVVAEDAEACWDVVGWGNSKQVARPRLSENSNVSYALNVAKTSVFSNTSP